MTLKPANESVRGHPPSATGAAFTSPCNVLFSSFGAVVSSFAKVTAETAATAAVEGAVEDTGAVDAVFVGAVFVDAVAAGFDAVAGVDSDVGTGVELVADVAGGSPDRTSNASGSSSESVTPPVEGAAAGLAGALAVAGVVGCAA